jgi:hypothetical protein
MKSITIKVSEIGRIPTLAHPQAALGLFGSVSIYRVLNIPNGVTAVQVLHLFDNTAIVFPDKLPVPWTVLYSQLSKGAIINQRVLVRADQLPVGAVFSVPRYPGVGVRTCHGVRVRQIGGDKVVVINCGVGISAIELTPSEELEVNGGAA